MIRHPSLSRPLETSVSSLISQSTSRSVGISVTTFAPNWLNGDPKLVCCGTHRETFIMDAKRLFLGWDRVPPQPEHTDVTGRLVWHALVVDIDAATAKILRGWRRDLRGDDL